MTDDSAPRPDPETHRPARKRRAARVAVEANESTLVAAQLFEQGKDGFLAGDFTLLRKIAEDCLCRDPQAPAPPVQPGREALFAKALAELVGLIAGRLVLEAPASAARAIDVYVEEVLPRAWAAGQRPPDGSDLAAQMGVTRLLDSRTLETLVLGPPDPPDAPEAEPPAAAAASQPEPSLPQPHLAPVIEALAAAVEARAEPAPGQLPEPEAGPEPAPGPDALFQKTVAPEPDAAFRPESRGPEPAASSAAGGYADPGDRTAAVSYDEIRRACLVAKAQNRKVVAVVGLAATGKSFFVRRLIHSEMRSYSVAHLKGLARTGAQTIDRTKEVLLYRFDRIGRAASPNNFDIYDIPGDQFVKLVRNGFVVSGEDRDTLRLLYAICAFADAMVFVAPALQVLKRKSFVEEGDDLGLDVAERQERVADIQAFIQSLNPMSKVLGLLRERLRSAYRELRRDRIPAPEARARASDKAIDEILAMSFEDVQHALPRSPRLDLPAMLLLSRADELRNRIGGGRDGFDYDPTLQLVLRGREHLDHLAGRFDMFSVDFLTAEDGHRPGQDFDPDRPTWGSRRLVEDWLLPAVAACRRPRWTRFLQSPSIALTLRRWLDPRFAQSWDRETPLGR